jgi:hypothetical protein
MVSARRYITGTSKIRKKKSVKVLVTSDDMVTNGQKKDIVLYELCLFYCARIISP